MVKFEYQVERSHQLPVSLRYVRGPSRFQVQADSTLSQHGIFSPRYLIDNSRQPTLALKRKKT
ncbi:hypothetical protein GE21DRAFT_1284779 [Neurospora crassa]|nr:hypothetical protein GE21DRAFT_1284779 [Neurospora crassa]